MTGGPETGPLTGLVAGFSRAHLARNGVPDDGTRRDRVRCLEVIRAVLGDDLVPDGLAVSPLGVEWTEIVEAHVAGPVDPARLSTSGWLALDRLVGGNDTRRDRPRRWAVVEENRVLGAVRLVERPVDPVRSVLDGCRERGEVRLRDVLELCALSDAGAAFPPSAAALRAAADVESGLGGRSLARWASGRTASPPVRLTRPGRRLVVALSGVDGSGKSTLRAALADSLGRAGVPVSTVWVRPGMGLGPLTALAAWAKRVMRQDAAPGVRAMADPTAARPASRRGAVGYLWSWLVSCSFLVGVWRQHRDAAGVVLYDRHLVDALATLDFAYEGVDLRLQHRVIRALFPRADVRLYLDVPAEVSVARKPEDVLGEHAVRSQLAAYAHWLERIPPTTRLDATRTTEDVHAEVFDILTSAITRRHRRRRSS